MGRFHAEQPSLEVIAQEVEPFLVRVHDSRLVGVEGQSGIKNAKRPLTVDRLFMDTGLFRLARRGPRAMPAMPWAYMLLPLWGEA